MKIVYVRIEDLKPYEKNPRRIPEKAIKAVANSIKEFGWKSPVVIDKDNVIVAGHTRYKAALLLGLSEIPCLIADDLTPEKIKQFRLADNKTSELSSWDLELLDFELQDFKFEMTKFGFEAKKEISNQQNKNEEIDIEDFDDNKFEHKCPKCGFKF